MPQLSIIVPVYKVENYIQKCVDSILAQTFGDFECLLTDDGSPDRCGEILDAYAKNDSRLIVIHQPNGGVSSARNKGLRLVRGNYVGFVDSDDWIEPEMYGTMLNASDNGKYDMICCGYKEYGQAYSLIENHLENALCFDNDSLVRAQFGMPNCLSGNVWNKIFKSYTVRDSYFPEKIRYAEDWLFLFSVYEKSNHALKIPNCFYNFYTNYNSATHTVSVDNYYEGLAKGKLRLLLLGRRYSTELGKYALDKYLDDCLRYLPKLVEVGKKNHEKYIWKYCHIKVLMLREIICAKLHGSISMTRLCSYLYAWFTLKK